MPVEDKVEKRGKTESIYGVPGNSPGFLLWQVNNKWQREQYKVLKDVGLTHVQFVLLAGIAWLGARGEKVTQATLSNFVKSDKMMTSQVIRKLIGRGFVIRARDQDDPRSYRLELTEEGLKLAEISFPMVECVDRDFFGSLQKEEMESFLKVLEKLSSA